MTPSLSELCPLISHCKKLTNSQLKSLLGMSIPTYPDEEAGLLRTYAVSMPATNIASICALWRADTEYAIGHLGSAQPAAVLASLLSRSAGDVSDGQRWQSSCSVASCLKEGASSEAVVRLCVGVILKTHRDPPGTAALLQPALAGAHPRRARCGRAGNAAVCPSRSAEGIWPCRCGAHPRRSPLAFVALTPGVPAPSLPTGALSAVLANALGDVFTLAIVAYAIAISVARTYAVKARLGLPVFDDVVLSLACGRSR